MPLSFDPYHLTLIFVALITGVISPVVIQVTKYYLSLLRHPKINQKSEIVNILKLEEKITQKLEAILNKYKADRVWVIEFHNGGHTYTGRGMQKLSETYEVSNKGISLESNNTQNLPTSLFSSSLIAISNSFLYIENVNDNESKSTSSTAFKEFLTNRGVKSFIGLPIKNIENNLVGVLCLDNVLNTFQLKETEIYELKQDASILAGYLESILKYVQNKE